jgi:hypothetical protein
VEKFNGLFNSAAPNHVLMFAKLFCAAFAFQLFINFGPQLRYFKTQPTRIYGKPIKLFRIFQLPALSENQFIFLGTALILSLVFAATGIYTRPCLIIALLCYFPYFNSIQSLAYVQRKTNLLPLVLLVLAVSPSINKALAEPSTSWELVLIKIAISQMYFSAGLQKVLHSFFNWCNGAQLQAYLLENYLWSDRRAGYLLAQKRWLCSILSMLTLVFELTFWVILFFPQLTFVYIALALFFHLGTLFTMRINYLKYLGPVYLVFFTGIAFWIKDHL